MTSSSSSGLKVDRINKKRKNVTAKVGMLGSERKKFFFCCAKMPWKCELSTLRNFQFQSSYYCDFDFGLILHKIHALPNRIVMRYCRSMMLVEHQYDCYITHSFKSRNTWNAFYYPTHKFCWCEKCSQAFHVCVLPFTVRLLHPYLYMCVCAITFSADIQLGKIEMKVNKSFAGSFGSHILNITKVMSMFNETHQS